MAFKRGYEPNDYDLCMRVAIGYDWYLCTCHKKKFNETWNEVLDLKIADPLYTGCVYGNYTVELTWRILVMNFMKLCLFHNKA
jgi:hypothetical protein